MSIYSPEEFGPKRQADKIAAVYGQPVNKPEIDFDKITSKLNDNLNKGVISEDLYKSAFVQLLEVTRKGSDDDIFISGNQNGNLGLAITDIMKGKNFPNGSLDKSRKHVKTSGGWVPVKGNEHLVKEHKEGETGGEHKSPESLALEAGSKINFADYKDKGYEDPARNYNDDTYQAIKHELGKHTEGGINSVSDRKATEILDKLRKQQKEGAEKPAEPKQPEVETKEAHEKRGFDEKKGDVDITQTQKKITIKDSHGNEYEVSSDNKILTNGQTGIRDYSKQKTQVTPSSGGTARMPYGTITPIKGQYAGASRNKDGTFGYSVFSEDGAKEIGERQTGFKTSTELQAHYDKTFGKDSKQVDDKVKMIDEVGKLEKQIEKIKASGKSTTTAEVKYVQSTIDNIKEGLKQKHNHII